MPFGLVRQAAVDRGVVDLLRDRLRVGDAALHRPGPAVHAAVARVHEVVERHELRRQLVVVRRQRLAELRQAGSAFAPLVEVAEHLVEGAVLLHDVDHVLDVLAQELHRLLVVLVGSAV